MELASVRHAVCLSGWSTWTPQAPRFLTRADLPPAPCTASSSNGSVVLWPRPSLFYRTS